MKSNITELEKLAELKSHLVGLIDKLNGDEIEALALCAEGLVRGRTVYGPLDTSIDGRDYANEAIAELRDSMVYSAAGLLRLRRSRR